MNISKSLFENSEKEKLDNKLEIITNSSELKKQKAKLIINSYNNSSHNIISQNNENKININNIYNNNNYQEENNKLSNDDINDNNIINNKVSPLKIKIPYEIMDNHPIFLVQRIEEKNKNCNNITL